MLSFPQLRRFRNPDNTHRIRAIELMRHVRNPVGVEMRSSSSRSNLAVPEGVMVHSGSGGHVLLSSGSGGGGAGGDYHIVHSNSSSSSSSKRANGILAFSNGLPSAAASTGGTVAAMSPSRASPAPFDPGSVLVSIRPDVNTASSVQDAGEPLLPPAQNGRKPDSGKARK